MRRLLGLTADGELFGVRVDLDDKSVYHDHYTCQAKNPDAALAELAGVGYVPVGATVGGWQYSMDEPGVVGYWDVIADECDP